MKQGRDWDGEIALQLRSSPPLPENVCSVLRKYDGRLRASWNYIMTGQHGEIQTTFRHIQFMDKIEIKQNLKSRDEVEKSFPKSFISRVSEIKSKFQGASSSDTCKNSFKGSIVLFCSPWAFEPHEPPHRDK